MTDSVRRDIVDGWTLEQVVGQLFCVSVGHHTDGSYGFTDTVDEVGRLVRDLHLGGVCYFPAGPDGAQPAVIEAQLSALQAFADVPLLMTIDQEGGLVTRMREPATRWPSAMAQAAAFGGPEARWSKVTDMARASGRELRAVGVSQTYAPVADTNVEPGNPAIGIRSASSDVHEVGRFVEASVQGFAEAGVGSCLKHFPGHGDTAVDSHFGLPTLDLTVEEWYERERVPFAAGIAAGVDAVMIGHLRAPGLDPSGAPATFSHAIVTGLLREGFGFDGVIVTDAMDMAGAQLGEDDRGRSGSAAACVAALAAGVDQVLMPRDVREAVAAVTAAARDGELDEQQLRASAGRIVAMKDKLGLFDAPTGMPADVERHRRLAQMAISRALTWRDPATSIRIDDDRPLVVLHDPEPPSAGRGIEDVPTVLADTLRGRGWAVEQLPLGADLPEGADVILVTRDAWRFDAVADQVREVAGRVRVALAARSPYDSALVPEHVPMLLSYGDLPGVGEAVADALIAGVAMGALPVDLPSPTDPSTLRWRRSGSAGASPVPAVTIRPYRDEDRAAIGRICVRTGDSGGDATGKFFSDDLLPWIYAYPYVDYEPESCRVVDVGGEVVGYIIGVADVRDFARWWEEHWRDAFAARFPYDPAWTDQERALVRKGLEPSLMVSEWVDEIPADLHIDLLPVVQGMGLGRALIDEFRAVMRGRGVLRVGLGVGGRNTRAIAFYKSLGFEVVREFRNAEGEFGGYAMSIDTSEGDVDAIGATGH
ncbi:GNAT family N-acetyltransferase [Tessaracoccus oleiagri]|uniref:beta-N-acetylhexosaminidase n=1 Tax=Tessaracoccus oleiagri TaxID=686624 RepID=A0A1G9HYQ2_9ACTN|nr:GNAT family N-acetyltransferase [Tessaracoccus oleiagri]SDL18110.1 Acetyltransferase (GNAT) family protein [Tessaracoccus oleiagri]